MTIPKHLSFLNSELIDVLGIPNSRTILTFPPRHAKSETTSRWFPVSAIGTYPHWRVMLTSYAADFAASWGRKARDVMAEHGPYVYGLRVREDVAARDEWEVEAYQNKEWVRTEGGMKTAGVGGPITGRGANLIIVDDPIKNSEEAFSRTVREKIWDWFNSTLMTRIEPGCRVIIIMTRWHEDDLVGRLVNQMAEGGEQWNLINLPALAEANDPLGRQEGEALWPERYNEEALSEIRMKRGEYWFSALYQQRPTPIGSAIFRQANCTRYTIQGNTLMLYPAGSTIPILWDLGACIRFSTVDLATSLKETADFTVISTWARTPHNDLALLDVRRARFEGPDHVGILNQVWLSQRPGIFFIEASGFQLSTVQSAVRAGLPVQPAYPDKDKHQRALPAAAKLNSGKIALPKFAEWLPDVEAEIFRFPATEHDDITDTFSLAAIVDTQAGFVGNL
jgi:predicted phage terminase large subunit-like protein